MMLSPGEPCRTNPLAPQCSETTVPEGETESRQLGGLVGRDGGGGLAGGVGCRHG